MKTIKKLLNFIESLISLSSRNKIYFLKVMLNRSTLNYIEKMVNLLEYVPQLLLAKVRMGMKFIIGLLVVGISQ